MKSSNQGTFNLFAFISFVISAIMIYLGYDKVANYYSTEYSPSLNKNAYVGGDAYNYIINSNYATGYYVLALMFVVLGIGLIIIGYLDSIKCMHLSATTAKLDETQIVEVTASNDEVTDEVLKEDQNIDTDKKI